MTAPDVDGGALAGFAAFFVLVTVMGFVAARWRRPATLAHLDEWGLGGRKFGTWITWFLVGGDFYTAYTIIAVPALVYAVGAYGFFALPYTIIVYPFVFAVMPLLWREAKEGGHVTAADVVHARYGSRELELAVAITGVLATMPYIALQLVGMAAVFKALGLHGELPLVVAFIVLAVYTYSSGLRAPALIAFVKDTMIYIVVIAAVALIPAKLGGYAAVFEKADAFFTAKGAGGLVLDPSLHAAARPHRAARLHGPRGGPQAREQQRRRAGALQVALPERVRRLRVRGDRHRRARARGRHEHRRGQPLHAQFLEGLRQSAHRPRRRGARGQGDFARREGRSAARDALSADAVRARPAAAGRAVDPANVPGGDIRPLHALVHRAGPPGGLGGRAHCGNAVRHRRRPEAAAQARAGRYAIHPVCRPPCARPQRRRGSRGEFGFRASADGPSARDVREFPGAVSLRAAGARQTLAFRGLAASCSLARLARKLQDGCRRATRPRS